MHATTRLALLVLLLSASTASAQSLVVIANRDSGITALDRTQVSDIYMGRYRRLPSGRTALPIDVGGTSRERIAFYRRLIRKEPAEVNAYWARLVFSGRATPPFQVANARAAVELVASNRDAIGYVDRAFADGRVRIVHELAD